MDLIWYILVFGVISGFLGVYVAIQKNRSSTEGFVLGFLFSLLGVIILALLPSNDKPFERQRNFKSPTTSVKSESLSSEEKNVIGFFAIIIMCIIAYTLWSSRH